MPDNTNKSTACCSTVESIVTVDERGQMVLPKDIRKKANINPGDKLAVIGHVKEGSICCISLMKIEDLAPVVKGVMGPMLKDIID
jgi:antitoxin PrlF